MSTSARRRRVMRYAEFQDGLCFYCSGEMFFLDPGLAYGGDSEVEQSAQVASEDHVVPTSEGGSRHRSNVVVCHRQCNSIKGRSMPTDKMLHDLRVLNDRRGFHQTATPGQLTADTFMSNPSPALRLLLSDANAMEGKEGAIVRRTISRKLARAIKMQNGVRDIKDRQVRLTVLAMLMTNTHPETKKLPDSMEPLLANVIATLYRKAIADAGLLPGARRQISGGAKDIHGREWPSAS